MNWNSEEKNLSSDDEQTRFSLLSVPKIPSSQNSQRSTNKDEESILLTPNSDEPELFDMTTNERFNSRGAIHRPAFFSEADEEWTHPEGLGNFEPRKTSNAKDNTFEKTQKYKDIWSKYVPRVIQQCFYSGSELNIIQIHIWAVIIGILGGLIVVAYQETLELGLEVVWHLIPDGLKKVGILNENGPFKPYNYNWIAPLILLTLGGVTLLLFQQVVFFKGPSGVPDLVDKIHERGYISLNHLIPMAVTSLITIIGGSSVGPEAAVLIIMASISGYIGRVLSNEVGILRIMTIIGMSAGLSGFFGLPLGGGIFVLEIPHRMGLQYSEAISTSILASIISAFIAKAIKNEDLGGSYQFPDTHELRAIHFVEAAGIGVVGAITALLFTFTVHKMKQLKTKLQPNPVLLAFGGAIMIGLIGTLVPSSMFWSEKELKYVLASAGNPGLDKLPNALTPGLIEDIDRPNSVTDFLLIAIAKFFAIAFSLVAEFPGGIIFPLFYLGAAIGQAISALTHLNKVVCIISMMGSLEASITRTPWATAIILLQIHAPFMGTQMNNFWTATLSISAVSIFVALFLTRPFRFYPTQHSRTDLNLQPKSFGSISFQNNNRGNIINNLRNNLSEDDDFGINQIISSRGNINDELTFFHSLEN